MAKNNRFGQSKILTDRDYSRINRVLISDSHKLFLAIARFTGERWGAIRKLKVRDVYHNGEPRDSITFRASTRKASPDGSRQTRECPVHPDLLDVLKLYRPKRESCWLFPGSDPLKPIAFVSCSKWLVTALERAGLSGQGYSTHSTRRTFVTRLAENGIDVKTIAKITGHRSVSALLRYIEVPEERIRAALATL